MDKKAQGNKVKENDKTQLFVNGVECGMLLGYMAKSAKIYYCLAVAFSAIFSKKNLCTVSTLE